MCLHSCSCAGFSLIPLSLCSIAANILLYVPNGDPTYAANNQLSSYVLYFEGICFAGILMLFPAAIFILLDHFEVCEPKNRNTKTWILLLAALCGVAFSSYCVVISVLGLVQGPYCRTNIGWGHVFQSTNGGYLTDRSTWTQCLEPAQVVEWNVTLFSILLSLSGVEMILCFLQALKETAKLMNAKCASWEKVYC
ncbi:transmembrane 4 L6 family member 18 [Protopterus annectens]|uniref:transmembrane 4 L6 family member 18 n=1 Tax=Protopterus annectens TaxID=7888 RepID=UPI001CFAE39A|nr:transmembrane 4 L6 family member 18 [Protopterus annectens]